MKRLIITALVLLAALNTCISAQGNTTNSLVFEPVGGGKFIYCNNPEELVRDDLADDGKSPAFLMNNEGLGADNYRLYISHFNRVTKNDDAGNTYPGENIWIDAVFTAREDCEIEISRTAFEVPENITEYLNYETIQTENPWSSLRACAQLLGKPIRTLRSDKIYSPSEQTAVLLTLKKGESVFLSEFTSGYTAVPYPKHVLMGADFTIISGKADVDIFAAKNRTEDDGEIRYPDVDFENCGFGIYKRGRTQKGIADSLPEVRAELEYEIDDYTRDGAYLPVTLHNARHPKGIAVNEWVTNINPRDDMYSSAYAAESDILPLVYTDDSKLNYYGDSVPDSERDNVWVFDTHRSDTMEYTEASGKTAAEYSPNYLLDVSADNIGYACSLGNYGVTVRYHLKVTNNGTRDRYFEYAVKTAANVITEVLDSDGNDLQPVISKGQSSEISEDIMASVCLKAGEVTEFSIGMTLPVQNYGGQRQSFRISDKPTELDFRRSEMIKPIFAKNTISQEYDVQALLEKADKRTKFLLGGNLDDMDIVPTDDGFAAYYKTTAGNPWYYGYYWQITGKIFILDSDFNIVKEIYPGSQPIEMTYANGKIYVKTIANGSFYIDDDYELHQYDGYILPRGNGNVTVSAKDGRLLVSEDGENYYKVAFQSGNVPFAALSGGLFYWADNTGAAVSEDGIYWNNTECEVDEIEIFSDYAEVNGEFLYSFADVPRVRVNDEYLSFNSRPTVKDGRILVPVRFIFEKLGMKVLFDSKEGRITAVGKNALIKIIPGDETAYVNGKAAALDIPAEIIGGTAYVPLRFIADGCGFDTDWNGKTAVVLGEVHDMLCDFEVNGELSPVFTEDTSDKRDAQDGSEIETETEIPTEKQPSGINT